MGRIAEFTVMVIAPLIIHERVKAAAERNHDDRIIVNEIKRITSSLLALGGRKVASNATPCKSVPLLIKSVALSLLVCCAPVEILDRCAF